eukprot:COSAG01_NODE_71200_length_256_cov_1.318471_1_plen_74_part_01
MDRREEQLPGFPYGICANCSTIAIATANHFRIGIPGAQTQSPNHGRHNIQEERGRVRAVKPPQKCGQEGGAATW